jgi:hypothetical protein
MALGRTPVFCCVLVGRRSVESDLLGYPFRKHERVGGCCVSIVLAVRNAKAGGANSSPEINGEFGPSIYPALGSESPGLAPSHSFCFARQTSISLTQHAFEPGILSNLPTLPKRRNFITNRDTLRTSAVSDHDDTSTAKIATNLQTLSKQTREHDRNLKVDVGFDLVFPTPRQLARSASRLFAFFRVHEQFFYAFFRLTKSL